MPYKDLNKKRVAAKLNARKRRANPAYVKKQNERRKFLRDTKDKTKKREKEYYKKNRKKILERCAEYNRTHPQVRKKAQKKAVTTGKGKMRAVNDRRKLKNFYIRSQIKKTRAATDIEIKKSEILIYRIKKAIRFAKKNTKRPLI